MTADGQLLDVSEALGRLLDHFSPLEVIQIPLALAGGRILAEDVIATSDFPQFPNSGMDGFACHAADLARASLDQPTSLVVVGDIPAGSVMEKRLLPGEAMRIMTGAAAPDGADAVVPVEKTDFNQRQVGVDAPKIVKIFHPVSPGDNIRQVGEDIRQGEVVMATGQRIRPQDAGLLSMLGQAFVRVRRRPRVAILSSGDELVSVEQELAPGKIRDANTIMLLGLVEQYGGEAINLGIVPDRLSEIQAALARAVDAGVDLIVSSAGVSVGALDFVREAVEHDGAIIFWRVNMRPGKPVVFGYYRQTPFVGLPGNPVSAFVSFEVFLRPILFKMLGLDGVNRRRLQARMLEPLRSDGRETFLRGVVSWQAGELVGQLTGHQGSGNLRSLSQANALLIVPSGVKYVPTGAKVEVWMLGND